MAQKFFYAFYVRLTISQQGDAGNQLPNDTHIMRVPYDTTVMKDVVTKSLTNGQFFDLKGKACFCRTVIFVWGGSSVSYSFEV